MSKRALLLTCLASCFCACAAAQGDAHGGKADSNEAKPTTMVTPIFSETLEFPVPEGFVSISARTSESFFIQEMVLKGETADHWSQMITQSGRKGMSSKADMNPEGYLNSIAGGFRRRCPDTYSGKAIGPTTISGHQALIGWVSCGTVPSDTNPRSESTLLITIKGTEDYYTIQWSERGAASSQPITYDDAKWGGRLKKLSPIKTSPVVPKGGSTSPKPPDKK
jgi:hypothetical protein